MIQPKVLYAHKDNKAVKITFSEETFRKLADLYQMSYEDITFNQKLFLMDRMFNFGKLKANNMIDDYYVNRNMGQERLEKIILDTNVYNIFKFPILEVYKQYGTELAFYFDFVIYLSLWLSGLAVVGGLATVSQWRGSTIDTYASLVYSLFVSFWSIFWLKYWDRKVHLRNYQWNQNMHINQNIIEQQQIDQIVDDNGGGGIVILRKSRLLSMLIQIPIFSIYLLAIFGINYLEVLDDTLSKILKGVVNTLFMIFFDTTFYKVARFMVKYEDHTYYSSYRDSLIIKHSIFNFLNTFLGLIYRTLIKQNISELWVELMIQFALKEVAYRHVSNYFSRRFQKRFSIERMINNYQTIINMFIYTIMFAWVFPPASIIFFLNNFVEVFSDIREFIRYKNIIPNEARDIGIWRSILELLSFGSITINGLFVVFNSDLFPNFDQKEKLLIVIGLEHIFIIFKYTLNIIVPTYPNKLRSLVKKEFDLKRGALGQYSEAMVHDHHSNAIP